MGIIPKRVNIDAIKNCYVDEYKRNWKEIVEEEDLENPKDLLEKFLDGTLLNEPNIANLGFECWSLIGLLIDCYGEWENNNQWSPGGDIYKIEELPEFKPFHIDRDNRLKFPPSDDFPFVLTLENKDFQNGYDAVKKLDLEKEQILQFKSWVINAHKNRQDLVLYYG